MTTFTAVQEITRVRKVFWRMLFWWIFSYLPREGRGSGGFHTFVKPNFFKMLKYHYLFALILLGLSLNAQINSGTKVLGGQVSLDFDAGKEQFSDTSALDNNHFGIDVSPSFSVFVTDNWAIGGNLSYGYEERINQFYVPSLKIEERKYQTFTYGLGIHARRYFRLSKACYFTSQVRTSIFYLELSSKRTDNNLNDRSSIIRQLSASFRPGINYFLNRQLAITLEWNALNYTYSATTEDYLTTNHSLSFNLNISSFGVGLDYFF